MYVHSNATYLSLHEYAIMKFGQLSTHHGSVNAQAVSVVARAGETR